LSLPCTGSVKGWLTRTLVFEITPGKTKNEPSFWGLKVTENVELKRNIYQAIRSGDFQIAEDLTLKGMDEDFSNPDYEKMLKIIKFWQNRTEMFEPGENNGEKLIEEWDHFLSFCREQRIDNKKAVLSIKNYVFYRAIDLLIESYRLSPMPNRETLILLGQCFYEVGIVEKAIETLEYAMSIATEDNDVRIYTMLGNLYYETGNTDLSMIMFNEAFLKMPQLVNIDVIEYPAIKNIRKTVLEDGFKDNEILEWIPVYGYLYEGLTTRRKIEYDDYMELKEKIIDYEKSLRIDKKVRNIILPRLVNYYLWLLDYYIYQIGAFENAEKVVSRILELLEEVHTSSEARTRLLSRAHQLLRGILEKKNTSKVTKTAEENMVF